MRLIDVTYENVKKVLDYHGYYRDQINRFYDRSCLFPTIEVPTWIPVTERLPEPYKDVLVVEDNGWEQKVEVNSMLSNGWLYDGRTVTHWMPLPNPPKDGE